MLTVLFKNRRILKFKSKLTLFFPAINHLSGPLRKQNFTLTGSNGHGFVICDRISIRFVCFCVSGSVACDCNIIMIDSCEKRDCEGSF